MHALIVDLFGTLVPKWPNELSVARKSRMADAVGVQERAFRNAWGATWLDRELGRLSLEESIARALEEVAPSAAPDSVSRLRDIWLDPVTDHLHTTPRRDAMALLERARRAGLKTGLVSNAGPEVPEIFQKSSLAALIDVAVFSCSAGIAKPDPGIYLSACEALSVAPSDCIYVGDGGDEELQGALEVGMTPVLLCVESEIAAEGLPSGAASWQGSVIDSFNELWDQLGVEDGRNAGYA